MIETLLKKVPVGIIVFLMFAVTGIGAAEMLHDKGKVQNFDRSNDGSKSELNSQSSKSTTVNRVSDDSSSGEVTQSSKSSGDTKGSEIKQSSKSSDRRGDDDSDDDEDEDEWDDDSYRGKTTVQKSTTPAPVVNTTATFTMAQVSTHNTSASCYSVVSGSVYDLTTWINQHPGGSSAIKSMCGVDGTSAYNQQHAGSSRPKNELAGFKIGILAQ